MLPAKPQFTNEPTYVALGKSGVTLCASGPYLSSRLIEEVGFCRGVRNFSRLGREMKEEEEVGYRKGVNE